MKKKIKLTSTIQRPLIYVFTDSKKRSSCIELGVFFKTFFSFNWAICTGVARVILALINH